MKYLIGLLAMLVVWLYLVSQTNVTGVTTVVPGLNHWAVVRNHGQTAVIVRGKRLAPGETMMVGGGSATIYAELGPIRVPVEHLSW